MPPALQLGQLVEITGGGPVEIPLEWRRPGKRYDGPVDVTGQRGQVVKWLEDAGQWMVATFNADLVAVKEASLKPLVTGDIDDFDMALGPRSDPATMGEELANLLGSKGAALCRLFVAPEDLTSMVEVADRCVSQADFVRLPLELEPGYLGKDGAGKTMNLDLDSEDTDDFVKQSNLKIVEDAFSSVGVLLRPYTEDRFGYGIYSRSNTMLVLPFEGDEEAEYEAMPVENEEASSFLQMMYRAKLMVMVNAGPGTGTLTLMPKAASEAGGLTLTVKPGMMAVVSMTRFKFSYTTEGKALTVRTWYLDYPKKYEILPNPDADVSKIPGLALQGKVPTVGNPIAVVGAGARYAAGADTIEKCWQLYRNSSADTFCEFPRSRWDLEVYYQPDAGPESGKSYTKHGGFSDGIELFDNKFFDISPAEAKGMDPTQRQMLEVSYIALSEGGFNKRQLMQKPQQIAVMVGIDKNEWNSIPKDIPGGFAASSSANAITSNRFSYVMNLKGASITMDTACSASLVATHTSKMYLLYKAHGFDPCIAAITCGINLLLSPGSFVGCCGAGMLSHRGRCFTYNESADGYARGESTGAHCMKQMAYLPEEGVKAICAGSQVNQDGRSASLTAPNGPSQERCNTAVLREAAISPPEIDCTECHGTGTSLGDPIEIGAYQKVLSHTPREEPVYITTAKSNVGHCEGSAGVGGFLKCVEMAMHCECCPNVHLLSLNPHLDMDGFPGRLLTEGCTYRNNYSYNGVLSFGFGGTNACAQVWGRNILTSRGSVAKDAFKIIVGKITKAPAQEVFITGEDWEDWEMDGPKASLKVGDKWDVDVAEDGVVTYFEKENDAPDLGSYYYLSGSFNGWGQEPMEQDDMLAGVYSAVVTLGPAGSEVFQVVADEDTSMTFAPDVPYCASKAAKVVGPAEAAKEKCWQINGYPGERYRVEFCKSEADKLSVMWVPEL